MSYHHASIWINGRDVLLNSILNESEKDQNDFENDTFTFIRDWLTGKDSFEIETSGSTGPPKKIKITRSQMMASAGLTQQALGLQAGYTSLLCLSPRYIAGKMMLVRSLVIGMKILALTPSANVLDKIPTSIQIDFAAMVPYQIYDSVRSDDANRLNQFKVILIGGATLDAGTRALLKSFTSSFYATYGMTETISHVALQSLNSPNSPDEFELLPSITLQLDERGCLVIEAPYLPEKVFTNDLGKLTSKSRFKWLGRWDNVINTGGKKVIPEVLEGKLGPIIKGLAINQNFMVGSVNDPKLGQRIILLLEGNPIANHKAKELASSVRKSFERHEIPKQVLVLPSFEYSENGKVKRKETTKNSYKNVQNFTLDI